MAKGWIGIIVLLIISITYRILIKYLILDEWSGAGLYLGIIFGTISALTIYLFYLKKMPKTKEEAKNFEYKGLFNPLFGVILFMIISIIWTLVAIYGSLHFLYPIIGWLITLLYIIYWLAFRKYLEKRKNDL